MLNANVFLTPSKKICRTILSLLSYLTHEKLFEIDLSVEIETVEKD